MGIFLWFFFFCLSFQSLYRFLVFFFCEVRTTIKLEGTVSTHKTTLISDNSCMFGGLPKLAWGSIIHEKDLQILVKAVLLGVMVYYRERRQIKISQRKRHTGQSPGAFQTLPLSSSVYSGHISLLAPMCGRAYGVLPARAAHPAFGVQNFYWGFVM